MSGTYWDTELGRGGGGAEPQQLELNGFTLSLVPDGGSVQLPLGAISTLGPSIVVSSVQARDQILVGPNSNVFITSTGVVNATTVAVQLANATNVNATNTTTTNLNATQGNISTLLASNANMLQANANSISSGMAVVSSIRAGGITISKDTGLGYTKITGDSIGFYQNIDQYAPGQNINGRYFNGEIYNATSTVNATSSIALSNAAGNAAMTLNGHTLSNTANNLTYDGNPIQTGTRGDVSQWAQFPAITTVNAGGQSINNVNGLTVNGFIQGNGGTNLDNTVQLGVNKQDNTVNVLTAPSFNPLPLPFPQTAAGNFTVGFSNYFTAPNSTQPNIGLYGCNVNIAAGAPFVPTYAGGRTVNIDAYAGGVNIFPLVNADSHINITAHANSFAGADPLGAGNGNITLTAYNSRFGAIVPVPWQPGRIYLDAAKVDIGNNNYLGLGTSALITMQSAVVNIIAGLELGGISPFGAFSHTRFRSRDGVVIENTPLGTNNRDSRLYVRDIYGYSNFVNDFGPPALNLDGLDGGLTLNNFVGAYGQGDGAELVNIATMSGAYPTNVQNQIDALQGVIANLSTTGGTSNLALWFQYPALSTITLNQDINMAGATASISSLQGVIFNNTSGTLTNTYQKRVYIDGKTPTLASSMMYFDSNAISFINPSTLSYNNLRGQGFYFGAGTSNLLAVSSGFLQFNGQNLISTSGSGGGTGTVGPNLVVSTLTTNQTGYVQIGTQLIYNSGVWGDPDVLAVTDSNGGVRPFQAFPIYGGYMSGGFTEINNQSINFQQPNTGVGYTFAGFDGSSNIGLSNISSLNGIPISTFLAGGSVSTLQNWSYFPVSSNAIQFGNQTAWIKGEGNALFTTSNGSNTLPVTAKAFTVFDPSNPGVLRNIGFDASGVLTVQRSSTHPSDLRVSSIILNTSPLTTDGVDLYLNGSNIGSSNVASWATYVASSTIQGANIQLSNSGVSMTMFETSVNPADPRSTSIFFSPYQLQLANRQGTGQNLIGMTNQSNNLQIYNRAADGATIQTGGSIQNLRIIADTQLAFGYTFTSPSTLTEGLGVSSISINGNNNLTASNGALYFNGAVVNASNTVQQWAQFPAIQDVSMANSSITNVKSLSGGNLGSGGFNFTNLTAQITGSGGLTVQNPVNLYYSNAVVASGGNMGVSGLTSNYVFSPYGYAHQQITLGGTWFNTKVADANGQYQIRQFSGSNIVSTGTVYDTTFYPLPTYPITYCIAPGLVRTNLYSPAFGLQALPQMGTFIPSTRQGIVSFEVIVPASMSNTQAWIGCGPNASANYDDQHAVLLPPKDPYSGGYWNTISIFCDFTGWIGSNFIFRMDAGAAGQMTFRNVQYKPLPN